MKDIGRWITWSWRDLRGHWVRVVVIAVIIALGTGAYAGLSSNARWRLATADHNYELLNMYDLRVRLAEGSQVPEGSLIGALSDIEHSEWILDVEERLVVPTQVDASTASKTLLARGALIGVSVDTPGAPTVNAVHPYVGRALAPTDQHEPIALIERNFAGFHGLPESATIRIAGNQELTYIGHGVTPEYFIVQPEGELFFSQATYAAVFTSLGTAQRVSGAEGRVNDMVLTLTDGADAEVIAAEATSAIEATHPTVGVSIMSTTDDLVHTLVYEDVDNDQVFFNMLAVIIFLGAVAAAFNLTNRLVEQQRREIGISMALGVPRWKIAIRPMLVGFQIAVLGVLFGILIGLLLTLPLRAVLEDMMPFPVWLMPFQTGLFLTAAALGFVVPLVATAIPVWRAVRVQPVDAIRTGHLAARGGGLAPAVKALPLPGDTFAAMPFRNLLRAPRRAALTVIGIAAAISALVMIIGAIDSFLDAIDRGEAAATTGEPDRVLVDLNSVYPAASPEIEFVSSIEGVAEADPVLQIGGEVKSPADEFDVFIRFVDFEGAVYRPEVASGRIPEEGEILLASAAASDLGVGPGETVTLRHAVRQGPVAFTFVDTEYVVVGIHDHPFRIYSYLPISEAGAMGLGGLANAVDLIPEPGVEVGDLQRALFGSASVVSVQRADAQATVIRDFLAVFLDVFRVFMGVVLLLAVLIAFNAAGIGVEERRREHATMFAYGVPVRRVVRMIVVESFTIGLLATVLGVAGGLALLWWFLNVLAPESMPEIGFDVVLAPGSVAVAVIIGVVAVGLAPLLTAPRRLRRMDLPSTLRVME